MGSRNRRRKQRAREAAEAVAKTHFASVPVPAVAPTGGEEIPQHAVLVGTAEKFSRDLRELLDLGWRVVPGSVAGGGGISGGSQFVAVLFRPLLKPKT